ncbi:MAG TPA: hypothetical protein VFG00_02390, partial [Acidothermaceae bacterium]|nr:hypothetical protein [Acidothermaceae bacterium]
RPVGPKVLSDFFQREYVMSTPGRSGSVVRGAAAPNSKSPLPAVDGAACLGHARQRGAGLAAASPHGHS